MTFKSFLNECSLKVLKLKHMNISSASCIYMYLSFYIHIYKIWIMYHRSHIYIPEIIIWYTLNSLWQWTLVYVIHQEPKSCSLWHCILCSGPIKHKPCALYLRNLTYLHHSLFSSGISRYIWTWTFDTSVKLLYPQQYYCKLFQYGNCVIYFTFISS